MSFNHFSNFVSFNHFDIVLLIVVMYLQIKGYIRLLRRRGVGILDYKDITDVLKAVN